MRALLLLPCLVEDCLPQIGLAAAAVLERLGLEVAVPKGQTCCGQPQQKAGDIQGARTLARRVLGLFAGEAPVVCPSGSCAKTLRGYPALFEPGGEDHARAQALAARTFEFCAFVAEDPELPRLGLRLEARACLHRSCQLEDADAPARLLSFVRGLTLLHPERAERCCGFGGAFSLQFPAVSEALTWEKAEAVSATGAEILVSAEPSCLMSLTGHMARQGRPLPGLHAAQALALALGIGRPWWK